VSGMTLRTALGRINALRARKVRVEYWDAADDGLYICARHPDRRLTLAEVEAHADGAIDTTVIVFVDDDTTPPAPLAEAQP
jgi:hypothetical protein